jgi:hypothetical protein
VIALPLLLSLVVQETCAFDTAARIRPDTLILGLAPGKRDVSREIVADYLSAAEAIREQFGRLTMLRLPFGARVVSKKPKKPIGSYAPYGLHGFVRFQLDSTGRLTNTTIAASSASPDIADAVITAIERADSAYGFPPPSPALRREHGEISLRFVDTVETKDPSVALMRLIIPTVPADADPAVFNVPKLEGPPPLPGSIGTVVIEPGARVLIEFIIGTDSVIEPGSLQILESPNGQLATNALRGIQTARFRPARIGGCLVPVLVRQPMYMPERASGTVRVAP